MLYFGFRSGEMGFYDEKWEGVENKDNYDINKFEGEHKNGEPNGQGTVTYPDGGSIVGEFKDGLPNGQGTVTYSNGNKYVGGWKDGKINGQGTYTWSDGKKYVGEWKKGNYWNGNSYDKNGNFVRRYVNGEQQ